MTHSKTIEGLTERDRKRLCGILARLASPFENERAVAGRLASAFIAARGLVWADLPSLLAAVPPPATDRRRGRGPWQGYNRRRAIEPGQALSRLA